MTRAVLTRRLERLEKVVAPSEAGPIRIEVHYCGYYDDPEGPAELAQVIELPRPRYATNHSAGRTGRPPRLVTGDYR